MALSAFGQQVERDIVAEFLDHTEAIAAILGEAGEIDTRRLDGEAVVTVRAARDALVTLLDSGHAKAPERLPSDELAEITRGIAELLSKREQRTLRLIDAVGANAERTA